MNKYNALNWIKVTSFVVLIISNFNSSFAQCGFLPTCSNTNYLNFGMGSNSDGNTIEYDNFISSFHSTVVRTAQGTYKVWGEDVAADGTSDLLSPTEINATNFPGLTGTVLKAHLGSDYTPTSGLGVQAIILTTDGLFAWGTEGSVIHQNLTTSSAFQKITVNTNTNGLPAGVQPTDIKMLFVTFQTIALTTCSGSVYVLTQNGENAGNNLSGTLSAANATQWYQVRTAASGFPFISNVVSVRGSKNTLFALTSTGQLYTWGTETYLGTNTIMAVCSRATLMTNPSVNPIKMIGVTRDNANSVSSYYVLNSNGNLYALGGNTERQLGDWSTSERRSWIQPRYSSASGPVMNNIHWLSPNEHDSRYAAVNVLTIDSLNYNWGDANGEMLGRGVSTNANPGIPNGIAPTDRILAVETGGHTSMLAKKCEDFFGYVGHRIRGSMGDGTSNATNETTYTFATAVVYICGATTLDLQLTGSITSGSNGLYCNGTAATLIPSPPGGTLSLVSGPGNLVGDVVSFTGTGNTTVTIGYSYIEPSCGTLQSIAIALLTENCILPPTAGINSPITSILTCTTASISLTATGGGTYSWSNGASTATTSVTAPGTYTVTVTGPTGLTDTESITITQNNTAPVAAITTPTTTVLTCTTTNIGLTATGGGTYSWSNGATTAATSVSSTGTYTVTVTSANGCTDTESITITQNNTAPVAAITTPTTTVLSCTTTNIGLTATGGGTYSWSNGATTAATSVSSAGTYTVTVTAANGCTDTEFILIAFNCQIDAVNDMYGPINGYTGATTASVLTNDLLNGVAVLPSQITLTGVTVPTGFTLNANGTITVAAGTSAGIYSVVYSICVSVNPTFCDQAVVTITVSPALIDAVNNTFGPINGYTGATTASVLTNDLLNGVAVLPSQITLTGVTVPTGFTLNANGTITVAAGIAAGTYTVTYQICEVLNPTNCDQAVVTITVVNDPPIANTDSVSTDEDSPITIFILANDTDVDGNLDTTSVNITQQPSNGTINVDPITGAITYTPNSDFNGIDTLIYEVCDLGTPALCDTAIVIFTVNPINDAPIANADYTNTYEDTPVLIGILNNDIDLDGNIDSTTVTVIISPLNGTISIDPVNGAITYTPNPGFFGTDTMIYQICDDGTPLPAQCDTAIVVIQVISCLTIPTFDCDGDGATNEAESAAGTNPSDPCDYTEESVSQTPANEWYNLDCDGDGVTNAQELSDGTDLNNPCDVIIASQNLVPSDEWLDSDCDNDGISNGEEIELGNNIFDPCDPNPSLTSCIKDLIVPEAITPDGDGSNDSFVIPGIENYPDNKLIVFNRWGNVVFEKESYSNDWSGTTNVGLVLGNDELPSGTYYYLLDLKIEGMKILKGFVYIQR